MRDGVDIVALVAEDVPLKRVGASFRGLCPFHAQRETTPSFYVHPGRQMFHCFGCRASGDALGFAMRRHGWTREEASVRLAAWMARRAGRMS